jgi:hypothetical protein
LGKNVQLRAVPPVEDAAHGGEADQQSGERFKKNFYIPCIEEM